MRFNKIIILVSIFGLVGCPSSKKKQEKFDDESTVSLTNSNVGREMDLNQYLHTQPYDNMALKDFPKFWAELDKQEGEFYLDIFDLETPVNGYRFILNEGKLGMYSLVMEMGAPEEYYSGEISSIWRFHKGVLLHNKIENKGEYQYFLEWTDQEGGLVKIRFKRSDESWTDGSDFVIFDSKYIKDIPKRYRD